MILPEATENHSNFPRDSNTEMAIENYEGNSANLLTNQEGDMKNSPETRHHEPEKDRGYEEGVSEKVSSAESDVMNEEHEEWEGSEEKEGREEREESKRRERREGRGENEKNENDGVNSRSHHRSRGRVKDDKDGHLVFEEGDVLHRRYKLGKLLGKGFFAIAVQAEDVENNSRQVAVKIVGNKNKHCEEALVEVAILKDLRQSEAADKLICMIEDSFEHQKHVCMVFGLLGMNIEKFMELNQQQPFYVSDIRNVAFKLCKTVEFIHSKGLVHRDIFPNNIVFADSSYEKLYAPHYEKGEYNRIINSDVRLIDFGCAVYMEEPRKTLPTTYIKAPEVLLGLGWSYASDIWSIACTLFKMYQGKVLFHVHKTHDPLEHLAIIERIMGPLPGRMLEEARQGKGSSYVRGSKLNWDKESRKGIHVWERFQPFDTYMRKEEHYSLFDFMKRMLQLDPAKRCTASEALEHPFLHYNEA